jgi:glyoxylase-like metal-dependent hydrolase (beta-lactamase superfamily II)
MSGLKVHFVEAGFTKHLEAFSMRGGSFKPVRFPATVTVIEHPQQGVILFDSGYSARFFEQTKHFPNRFYSLITPVTIAPEQTALAHLKRRGISALDVRYVILSHFHADHIGGVQDFPAARFVYRGSAYEALRYLSNWGALRAGFLRGLLPADFVARSTALGDADFKAQSNDLGEFGNVCDLFNDGQLLIVDLPGHAIGQIGLVVNDLAGSCFFLVADAVYGMRSYQELRLPPAILSAIMANPAEYHATAKKIQSVSRQHPQIKIVPCHCEKTFATLPHDVHP